MKARIYLLYEYFTRLDGYLSSLRSHKYRDKT